MRRTRPRGPLHSWYDEAVKANRASPQAVKNQYANASICSNSRVVFNIGGNKYRLIAGIHFDAQRLYVKAVLTHREYDKGDWK